MWRHYVTAYLLISLHQQTFRRLPLRSADAFVVFTGLDPRPMESGQYRGRRRLSDGLEKLLGVAVFARQMSDFLQILPTN